MKHIMILAFLMPFIGISAQEPAQVSESCSATCTMPDMYKTEIVNYYIYTGNENNAPFTEEVSVELSPTRTVWKKMPDPDCPSGNPEDCQIWTATESEGETINLTVVTNIEKQNNYIKEQFSRQVMVKKGGYTENCEVICKEDLTPSLMYNVSMRLTDLGYYSGLIYSVFNSKIKAALEKYQRHNGLPVGHLNRPTMDALDLGWPYADDAVKDIPEQ